MIVRVLTLRRIDRVIVDFARIYNEIVDFARNIDREIVDFDKN